MHHFTELARRAMDAMGLDYQVVFPTPDAGARHASAGRCRGRAVGRAYNRWLIERILPEDERLKGLLYLPFNTPEACIELVKQYADDKNVIGFTVCSTRNKPVHHNRYMPLYALIEEIGQAARLAFRLPLGRPVVPAAQPLHLDARDLVRALQPDPHDQLDHQRAAGALPQAQAWSGSRAGSPGCRS